MQYDLKIFARHILALLFLFLFFGLFTNHPMSTVGNLFDWLAQLKCKLCQECEPILVCTESTTDKSKT